MPSEKYINAARVANQFSEAAKRYDANAQLQYRVMELGFSAGKKVFSEKAELLDVGCGTGFFSRHAQQENKSWVIDGLDMAPGMCEVSRPFYRNMIVADMQKMPVQAGAYDGVFSSLSVQWASDLQACFAGFANALKPSGYAVITSFVYGTLSELSESGKAAGANDLVMGMYDQEAYNSALAQAGFEVIQSDVSPIIEHVTEVNDLISHLRAIGATNAHRQSKKKLSAQERSEMIAAYERNFQSEKGLQVTWKPIILLAQKRD